MVEAVGPSICSEKVMLLVVPFIEHLLCLARTLPVCIHNLIHSSNHPWDNSYFKDEKTPEKIWGTCPKIAQLIESKDESIIDLTKALAVNHRVVCLGDTGLGLVRKMLPRGGEFRAWICVPEGCIQGTKSQLLTFFLWARQISLIERSKCCWGLHLFPFSRLVKGYSEGSPKGSRLSSLKAKEKPGKREMVNLEFAKSKRMIQDSDLSSREWKGYLSNSLGWMVPKLLQFSLTFLPLRDSH